MGYTGNKLYLSHCRINKYPQIYVRCDITDNKLYLGEETISLLKMVLLLGVQLLLHRTIVLTYSLIINKFIEKHIR